MANSIISSSLALVPSPRRNHYDVFITFRGEDTRNNFTDHLFDALENKDIYVFRDDTNLPKGESIGPELLRAIEGSHIFIAVFSRNYASSTWCLQELEKICECVEVSGKHVLPVFYDVDPSDVRHQKGVYGEAFAKHEQRFQQDSHKVLRWRAALTQVGNISGWDLRDKPQSPEIRKIVQRIINILESKSSCVSKDLVGMNSPIQQLQNYLLLDSVDGVRAIGICGMGGIGKTTLAMALYDQISHRFGASCFIDDVSKIYRLHDGPLGAQKQILLQTLGIENNQICNHYGATNLIRSRLRRERTLLILDNVNQVEQLEKIVVNRDWLGAGSRIIIISRDEHILKEYGVDVVYKVPLLNWTASRQLFCRKAFKLEKVIMSNYEKLIKHALTYAKGLPLAIKVLGSFLFGRNENEWRSALARLKESPDKDVMDVLQLSFDGLKESEKEIFLHIACFFNRVLEKYVKNVLNCCGLHADIGFRVLIDKSLISIYDTNIEMHLLLEELGIKIVQENSSKEPRKCSRLWSKKQLYNVMSENMEKHVEAIVLDCDEDDEETNMTFEHLSKMSNLRLLIIECVLNISRSSSFFSNELRYVEWYEYPFMYLPSSFYPNQLVELILKCSKLKQLWKNKKFLPNLKTLDLRNSISLKRIPCFGEFPNLERLNLKGCIKLAQLDPSIVLLKKLVYLNLKECKSLVSIPKSIFALCSLKDLKMSRCSKAFDNPRHLKKQDISSKKKEQPDISESASNSQSTPSSVFKLTMLPYHSSFSTPTVHENPLPSLHSLCCFRKVDISFCRVSQVPDAIQHLHWLERLDLGGNNFVTLPSLMELSRLVYLNLEHCRLLESLPQLPFPTAVVEWDHLKYNCKIGLMVFNCPKLRERDRCSSMILSWMIQFIQANPKSYPTFHDSGTQIVTPGSEIPSWINNQIAGGSIQIDLSPIRHDHNNNITGFVWCAVFSMAPQDPSMIGSFPSRAHMTMCFSSIFGSERRLTVLPVILSRDLVKVKSSHIWLIYFPRESSNNIWYEIIRVAIIRGEGLGIQVKNCGYRWVYKQDLQEFNLTTMNQISSSRKRKTWQRKMRHISLNKEL